MAPEPPRAADLAHLLASLPPFAAAWAYGSAVFHQPGLYGAETNVSGGRAVDFLISVDDAPAWHAANLAANPAHYSVIGRCLGGGGVAWAAGGLGAGAWFNLPRAPRAPPVPPSIKYGVLATDALIDDLTSWRRLHAAGRLQKPALAVSRPPPRLAAALAANAASAAAAALLLLPPTFDDVAWRTVVVGLSYGGDVRSWVGAEDSRKVSRVAAGSAAALGAMYEPLLEGSLGRAGGVLRLGGGRWAADPRPGPRAALLAALPPPFLTSVGARAGVRDPCPDRLADRVARAPGGAAPALRAALAAAVRASSARQAALGLLSAPPAVAARYVGAKLAKGWGRGGGG